MHRFYIPPEQCQGAVLWLTGREAHHALHVLRVRTGESVLVLDGEGHVLHCDVSDSSRDRMRLEVVKRRFVAPLPYQVTLGQAIPKGKLFDAIVQKATELGAFRIIPLVTERVVGKIESQVESAKAQKWRLVAIEAIKQCGSPWLPHIEPPEPIEKFIAKQSGVDLALVGSLSSDSRHPREYFSSFERQHGRNPNSVSIAIGPEGDFTPEELTILQTGGAQPITLGPLVLRTETAATYCLSIINYELQANSFRSVSQNQV